MHLTADQESLMEAVRDDSSRKVTALLKKGVSPDFIDDDDDTPLGEAINNGNLAMVKALVAAGADVNRRHGYDKEFPLDIADGRKENSYGSFDPYYEHDPKVEKIIEYLEQQGAKSAEHGRLSQKQQALLTAVEDGDTRKANALLDKGLDPDFTDENDKTPLGEAIDRGSLALVKALAEAGADINRVQKGTRQAPLDMARHAAREADLDGAPKSGFDAIARYLEDQGAVTARATSGKKQMAKAARGGALGNPIDSEYYFKGGNGDNAKGTNGGNAAGAPAGQRPVFRENTLADIFNAQKWIGKAEEMEQLWSQVPKRLQRSFDFSASLAEARRETLKQNSPKNFRLAPVNRPTAATPPVTNSSTPLVTNGSAPPEKNSSALPETNSSTLSETNVSTPPEANGERPTVKGGKPPEAPASAPAVEKKTPAESITPIPPENVPTSETVRAKRVPLPAPPKPETAIPAAEKPEKKQPKPRKPGHKPPGL